MSTDTRKHTALVPRAIAFVSLALTLVLNGMVNAQSLGPGRGADWPSTPVTVAAIQYGTLYAQSQSNLYLIDPFAQTATHVGPINFTTTDIAFNGTTLYGVTFSDLLTIDPTTGNGTEVGYTGYSNVNALTIAADGTAYAATINGAFITISLTTGRGSLIGYYGSGIGSAGDLVLSDTDRMAYAAVTMPGQADSWLAVVNITSGAATPIGDIGFSNVWGMSFKGGVLYGATNQGEIIRIDTNTGHGTLVFNGGVGFWGMATAAPALSGQIVTPVDRVTTGPTSVFFSANAWYTGGNGVKEVDFWVFFNGEWLSLGNDTSAPYSVSWTIPTNPLLRSQVLAFRIDVVGNDGTTTPYAGGVHWMYYIATLGGIGTAVENWVPLRAYLNQGSLGANGWSECNVSSMAMVMAMEGAIGRDYLSMANQANLMYQSVLGTYGPSGDLMVKVLRNLGFTASRTYPQQTTSLTDAADWQTVTSEIDHGRPVIVGSPAGLVTTSGHFIVGVGYWAPNGAAGTHYLIAYDPAGRWLGKTCNELTSPNSCTDNVGNYDWNTGSPSSHKGQWVYYDFDKFHGSGFLITVMNVAGARAASSSALATPLTPPDLTDSEPPSIGNYLGAPIVDAFKVFMPAVVR
jgi:hypothetical protein